MLADRARLFSYPFAGYWKDVGTIESPAGEWIFWPSVPSTSQRVAASAPANVPVPPEFLSARRPSWSRRQERRAADLGPRGGPSFHWRAHRPGRTGDEPVVMPFARIGEDAWWITPS